MRYLQRRTGTAVVTVTKSATGQIHALVRALAQGQSTLVTGPRGSGKTHLLRAVKAGLAQTQVKADLFRGCVPNVNVPLGIFAGAADLPPDALSSPAEVIDAFARRRSQIALLVDDVEVLDEASLFVIAHLVGTTQLRVLMTASDLSRVPDALLRLYDSGDVQHVPIAPLSDDEAISLVRDILDGPMTPTAKAHIVKLGKGNPLHVREIVRGSLDEGSLVETEHGWDTAGDLVPSPRLAQLVGERFHGVDPQALAAAARVAIAGEFPSTGIGEDERRALARADVIEVTECGWIRLAHPFDKNHLRTRFSAAEWHDFAHEVVGVLRAVDVAKHQQAELQANAIALEFGLPLDVQATIMLAEHALGAFDPFLALRAAQAAALQQPDALHAHRLAGVAASSIGHLEIADEHFAHAQRLAGNDHDKTLVALAMADYQGACHHNASAALAVVNEAAAEVVDPGCLADLQRAGLRWSAVAGAGGETIEPPEDVSSATSAMGLIAASMSGVITGPLSMTVSLLPRLRQIPPDYLAVLPGGATLIDLTAAMALSYTGDIVATRRFLRRQIAEAQRDSPESVGAWEYALGLLEFMSADAEAAYHLGASASTLLAWRDSAGLLPAATALTAAAASVGGREVESRKLLSEIPEAAHFDPKVRALSGWIQAWEHVRERRLDQAAATLIDTSRWLLTAQHTYFAGMLAHCAARMNRCVDEAAEVLHSAVQIAGGGMLTLMSRHVDAVIAKDYGLLEHVAADATELGMISSAADTWLHLTQGERPHLSELRSRRYLTAADNLRSEMPTMVLWRSQNGSAPLLTGRERQVAMMAAERFTSKEIAEAHGVSVNTVNNQLASVFRKLGVANRQELRDVLLP